VSVPGAGDTLPVMPAENVFTGAVMKELSSLESGQAINTIKR
jgi:hypothetical protein